MHQLHSLFDYAVIILTENMWATSEYFNGNKWSKLFGKLYNGDLKLYFKRKQRKLHFMYENFDVWKLWCMGNLIICEFNQMFN